MALYQITYDLQKVRDPRALHEGIRVFGIYARVQESTWLIRTTESAAQIRDYLTAAMEAEDGLLVARLTGEVAWKGLYDDHRGQTSHWIKWAIAQERMV